MNQVLVEITDTCYKIRAYRPTSKTNQYKVDGSSENGLNLSALVLAISPWAGPWPPSITSW